MRVEGLVLLAALAVAFLGWGRVVRRSLRLEPGSWPVSIALGMAVVVFLGGIFNALHLARTAAFAAIIVIGWAAAPLATPWSRPSAGRATVLALIAVLLAFPLLTQFPPRAFNFDDDFQKYFMHVTRMLQTGTANGGGPLSSIGFDTLGGQAFLQGLLGAFLPIAYVNGLDAVFGLFLCLALAAEVTARRRDLLPVAAVAAVSVIAINPQYVNVSALYTGSALILAALALATDEREWSAKRTGPHPIATGLVLAALVSLKSTFALFAVLYVPLAAICVARAGGGIRGAARWAAAVSISGAVFLAAWVVPHLPDLRAALSRAGAAGPAGQAVTLRDLFSTATLPYGASMAAYSILVIAAFCGALAVAWVVRHREPRIRFVGDIGAAAGVALLGAYVILTVIAAPRSYGLEHEVRLFIPLAIATIPAVVGIAAGNLPPARRWIAAGAVLILIPFAPSLAARVRQGFASGSVLAFSWLATDPEYLDYNRDVLEGPVRERIARVQQAVAPGTPILAWIDTPFYLNYARNPIIDVEACGLCDARAPLPPFDYVIWAYDGYAIKDPADYEERALDPSAGAQARAISARWVDLLAQIRRWRDAGVTLYDDGSIVVIRLAR